MSNKSPEIEIAVLKRAINAVLDHMIEDLGMQKLTIEQDYYWHIPESELYDPHKTPIGLDLGRLPDDADFVKLIRRGEYGDACLNLVHIAPLLRYIAETIQR
jgi:hypothetical protein